MFVPDDKLVRPTVSVPGPDTPEEVRIGLYVDRIWHVDPVAETFMIEGYLRLSWKDPRLAFNVTAGAEHRFSRSTWLPTWWDGADPTLPTIIMDYMTDIDSTHRNSRRTPISVRRSDRDCLRS